MFEGANHKHIRRTSTCSGRNARQQIYYIVLRGENENSIDAQLVKSAIEQGVTIEYNTSLNISEANIVATGPSTIDFVAYGELYEDANIDDSGYVFLDQNYYQMGISMCYLVKKRERQKL